ncbi:ribosomal RNA processing protein 1 homolog [Malaya genurostris]|uniref:ribosomal RNA processing protein 1 homolog n=1 Tax=Malaya genurostris TaxID=325434 RepID=UPI0026F38ABD|nr:ribosomal RNA processing protein 1 homolog [Malaya genurostris]
MWMSDKPLNQENLADEIASLVRCFGDLNAALLYFRAFLETMCNEWFGIDRWRIDKFMMLVRRCTRQILIELHEAQWPHEHVDALMKLVENTILNPDKCAFGLTKHFDELLFEEVSKASDGSVPAEVIHIMVRTYAIQLLGTNDRRMIKHITSSIFHNLLYQSELGQDYLEKFDFWKKTAFVTGNIDHVDFEVQYESDEAEEENEHSNEQDKTYDPRAGQVDVFIHAISFDPLKIVDVFESNRFKSFVTSKGKKQMKMLVKQYKQFAKGIFPLGIQSVESISTKDYYVDIDQQVEELNSYHKELFKENNKNKLKCKEMTVGTKPNHDCLQIEKINSEGIVNKKKRKASKLQLNEKKLNEMKLKRGEKRKVIRNKKSCFKQSFHVPTEQTVKDVLIPIESSIKAKQNINKLKEIFDVKDESTEQKGKGPHDLTPQQTKLSVFSKRCKKVQNPTLNLSTSVENPFTTPKSTAKSLKRSLETPTTTDLFGTKKRVKIALNKNISQDLHQHIQKVKNSPQLPYDSSKKPSKGALKPNLIPSPINPFYRKKIGFKLKHKL